MFVVADTTTLEGDGVISPAQAREMIARSRAAMVALAVNTLLTFGILLAAGGAIFWLADALLAAVAGGLALALGFVLGRRRTVYAMLGAAATLVGAAMLIGGATLELADTLPDVAGWIGLVAGAVIAGGLGWCYRRGVRQPFVVGAICAMGVGLHLFGAYFLLANWDIQGLLVLGVNLYAFAALVGAGMILDVRLITALSLVPFAQALDTGTSYFEAAYVFFSPETTLSILQMAVLIGLCLWLARRQPPRIARHLGILAILAFVVLNLCALVGSIWGDVVGASYIDLERKDFDNWQAYYAARDAAEAQLLHISDHVYSILWALALALTAFWAGHSGQRGLFNAVLTFGAIHAYTQLFESFADAPLAYLIAGLAAIGLAWGAWRLNHWMLGRANP